MYLPRRPVTCVDACVADCFETPHDTWDHEWSKGACLKGPWQMQKCVGNTGKTELQSPLKCFNCPTEKIHNMPGLSFMYKHVYLL